MCIRDSTYTATLDDGEHNIVINAQDNDGNVAAQKKVTFKVDTVPPELSVSNPPEVLVTNKNQLSIAGETNDATSAPCNITVKLNLSLIHIYTTSFLVIASKNPLDGGLAAANIENMAVAEGAGALYSGYMMRVIEACLLYTS